MIQVFQQEIDAGLTEAIRQQTSVAYLSPLLSGTPEDTIYQKVVAEHQLATAENRGQFDLFYLKDVLASTGWNKNRDVFDRILTWNARHTAVDKAFNFQHDPNDILGHITSSYAVNDDMSVIADDTNVEDLPARFHIVNGSVIYRYFDNSDRAARIERLIAEIKAGDWFVSMECLFDGFDYAIMGPNGEQGLLRRNEQTAHLTKHLSQYGGTGSFVDMSTRTEFMIGRLMHIIAFSGKGLVLKPGNSGSVILSTQAFQPAQASLITMEIDPMENENLIAEVAALKAQLAEAKAEITNLTKQAQEVAAKNYEASVASLKAEVADRDGKLSVAVAAADTLKSELSEKTAALATASEALAAAQNQLNVFKLAEAKAARVTSLLEKGATPEKATELVEKFASFSDEQFESAVAYVAVAWETKTPEPSTASDVLNDIKNKAAVDPALATASDAGTASVRERTSAYIKQNFISFGR